MPILIQNHKSSKIKESTNVLAYLSPLVDSHGWCLMIRLERKIISRTFCSWFLCWREWCCSASWRELCSLWHTCSRLNLSANYIIGADFIKPTAIVFMSINIKLYGEIFSLLDIELFNTVLAKNPLFAGSTAIILPVNSILLIVFICWIFRFHAAKLLKIVWIR